VDSRELLPYEGSTQHLMRLGIFSDVHANIEALTAVMERLRQQACDKLFCLGDVVGYGASCRRSPSSSKTT